MAEDPAAAVILRTLDRHLSGPAEVRLLGGAAMTLAYGMGRTTEDVDLLLTQPEAEFLAEHRDLGPALEATNAELEPLGLYITHIWGPEQEILGPGWRERCRPVPVPGLRNLTVVALGPLDLLTTKLCRADDLDLADIAWLIDHEHLDSGAVREALAHAVVPDDFREDYPRACARVEALLRRPPGA